MYERLLLFVVLVAAVIMGWRETRKAAFLEGQMTVYQSFISDGTEGTPYTEPVSKKGRHAK